MPAYLHFFIIISVRGTVRARVVEQSSACYATFSSINFDRLIAVKISLLWVALIYLQLYWLPIRRRVDFKIASLVYQVLLSKVPTYLADHIHLASENFAGSLRSSSGRKCSVTRVHSHFGDRFVAAAGPRICNNLPASLRDKEVSCTEFRR